MSVAITKTFRFEASHQLPNHSGKCARPHGHSYVCEVTLVGVINTKWGEPDEGMVCDFDVVKKVWKDHLEPKLDHRDLNESIGSELPSGVTTAEQIAWWIMQQFSVWLFGDRFQVESVTVWETATGRATVRRDAS